MTFPQTLASSADARPDLDALLGGFHIGALVSFWGFGILCVQVHSYFNNHSSDPLIIRGTVWAILIVELFHTILIGHGTYTMFVKNFGNIQIVAFAPLSFKIANLIQTFAALIVQFFFAYRIYKFSRSWIIPAIWFVSAITRLALSLIITIQTIRITPLSRYLKEWGWSALATVGVGAAQDILIASAMVYYLRKKRTEIHRTQQIVNKLMLLSVESGTLTSVVAVAMFILVIILPENSAWTGLFFVYAKTYSNAIMISLNARSKLVGTNARPSHYSVSSSRGYMGPSQHSVPMSPSAFHSDHIKGGDSFELNSKEDSGPFVHVTTQTHTRVDELEVKGGQPVWKSEVY